jgi:hypothetical protein
MTILGATSPPHFAIGESDYRDLRRSGMTYVDKTLWVADVLGHGAKVHVVPRPRRFGKTLNMSTLRYFVERTNEDRADLFADTAIWNAENGRYREHFQRYPTIYLSFKDLKESSWEKLSMRMAALLAKTIDEVIVQTLAMLPGTAEPQHLAHLRDVHTPLADFTDALADLNKWLHEAAGERTIILIDEYDAPLHAAWQHGFWNTAVDFFRNFLSAGLKDNNHLHKGVLTGILKVAKEGIFSGLNHTDTATILTSYMSTRFGFTETEVAALADVTGCPEQLPIMQQWYNGYRFGQVPPHTMYNPWSILNFLSKHPDAPQAFWKNSSDNGLIRTLLMLHAAALGPTVEALLLGQTVQVVVDENVAMPQLHQSPHTVLELLFYSGYLTAKDLEPTTAGLRVSLRIPNVEVRYVFTAIFGDWLRQGVLSAGAGGGPSPIGQLTYAMLSGDADALEEQLEERLVTMLSHHDVAGDRVEAVYQAFLVGMLVHLEPTHRVYSNREAGFGRADVLVVPRQPGPGAVMELKRITRRETEELALEKAIAQLTDRDYAAEVRAGGATQVYQYAVVFDGKRCSVRAV